MKVHVVRPEPPWRLPGVLRPYCGASVLAPTPAALDLGVPLPENLVRGEDLPGPLPYHPWGAPSVLCRNCAQAEEMWRQISAERPLLTALHFAENVKGGHDRVERDLTAMLAVVRAHWDEYADLLEREQVMGAFERLAR